MRNALWMLLAMAILFSLWGLMADKAIAGDHREPQSRTQPLYSLEPTAKAHEAFKAWHAKSAAANVGSESSLSFAFFLAADSAPNAA